METQSTCITHKGDTETGNSIPAGNGFYWDKFLKAP
jgi:hypothetical protein